MASGQSNNSQNSPTALTPFQEGAKWGYCDKNNNIIIECIYQQALPFEGLLAAVNKSEDEDEGWGFINSKGIYVIPPGVYYISYDDVKNGFFREGLAPMRKSKEGYYGYIDTNGKEIIEFKYDFACPFSGELARVYKHDYDNELWGFIDKKGKEIIPLVYRDARDFSEGLAAVRKPYEKYGFIDMNNEVVIPFVYDIVHPFTFGLAAVNSGRWGYVDKSGKKALPFSYEYACPFYNKDYGQYALVKKKGEWFYIDKDGQFSGSLIHSILTGYVVQLQEALNTELVEGNKNQELKIDFAKRIGVFVIPVFNKEVKARDRIIPPKLNDSKVIYETIDEKHSALLVASVDSKWGVIASFIHVSTPIVPKDFKAGAEIGGHIKIDFEAMTSELSCDEPMRNLITPKITHWTYGVDDDGSINGIVGINNGDFYYRNLIVREDNERDFDRWDEAARDAVRGMDEETDGFWRDL